MGQWFKSIFGQPSCYNKSDPFLCRYMSVNFVQFLLELKNASLVKKESLSLEYSKIRESMTKTLYDEGFIQSFGFETNILNGFKKIWIVLRYNFCKSSLEGLQLLSKPSSVKFMKLLDISKIPDRKFVIFFSTDKGLLTTIECKKQKVGGKLLFIC